ncbi:cyclase family protein [Novosphingopyxis sp.]|uniref:cyclase family protein n=1 Tax=Novosphingopyxis sp. TaxID=2709690 RepID=UPI003B5B3C10
MGSHHNHDDDGSLAAILRDSPKNWGKWGDDDEIGSLNYLDAAEVLRGVSEARQGKTFTLQIPIGHEKGDILWPGSARGPAIHHNILDKGDYYCGRGPAAPGGSEYSDDMIIMYLQGSTQYDALGHAWIEDELYNGYDARTTGQKMTKADVYPIAERGVVGRGVLLDIARHRGKERLERGETVTHEDLMAVADAQGITIEKRDVLLMRTGWVGSYYRMEPEEFYADFNEPGLTYSPELVQWFADMEIPNLVTDTIANEVSLDPNNGSFLPLHIALMRNLGVLFTEIASLDALAEDCAADGQYSFLYTAAPLKVKGGSGAPVNPIVIK